ncbi:putative histone-lysine N-methyltransferase PRDM6 [Stylophora pistillata]|uniref:putative histone-lysine N-methyltransferase PRDM6 n=1 Tax=Stylophora pistillata TaxID=50429 RepID=UPI000C0480F1|nr:putative histone-lysine N-methyltransferase PRDM6 [Stylophora pistillata]XP_022781819.1 putative histone-lysine N-methyltransferase PRDM6 [Stylophora pistillata]XP_022781898.1 putative histone-lysine N-methyltransferase PRDM6 [Stylophora pistillata]
MDGSPSSTGSSQYRVHFTEQDLQYVLYGRNPVEVVQILKTTTEEDMDSSEQQPEFLKTAPDKRWINVAMETGQSKSARNTKLCYAVSSFPDEVKLCLSGIPGEGHGVCAKHHIPAGTWIGPYEGKCLSLETDNVNVTPDIDTSYMWEVYDNGKLAFFLDGSDTDTSSWMRFIRCARHKEEQNMFAFQHNKSIFYRAFREIPSGTELLVWYDDKYYLQHMGIPVSNWDKDISQHFPVFKGKASSTQHAGNVTISSAHESQSEQETSPVNMSHETNHQERSSKSCVKNSLPPCKRQVDKSFPQETERPLKLPRMQQESSNGTSPAENNSVTTTGIQLTTGYRKIYDKVLENIRESDDFKCGQCKMSFTQRSLLNNHLCSRMPCKPYRCGHCHESFAQPKELRMHAVVHVSEKPFKCGYCLRSFSGATTVNNHMRTHTGEKPFSCERCGKSFSQASQLSRHRRICIN